MKIDHIEIFVPDRTMAAKWYGRVLGFHLVEEHADWADDGGPVMIANEDGQMIALFEGEPQGDHPVRGIRRIAFRVNASAFEKFVRDSFRSSDQPINLSLSDHTRAYSAYFKDPFGNLLEVTTYEYAAAKSFVDSIESQ